MTNQHNVAKRFYDTAGEKLRHSTSEKIVWVHRREEEEEGEKTFPSISGDAVEVKCER